jgi:hypothetical protein
VLHTVVVSTSRAPDGTVSRNRTETWQQTSPPYDHRIVSGNGLREIASIDGRPQSYDRHTNTVFVVVPGTKLPPPSRPSEGTNRVIENLRDFLAKKLAREVARPNVGGRDAIQIAFQGGPRDGGNMTLVVDARTYEPIESTAVADDGTRVTDRFVTYDLLPATPAVLASLDLTARYPDARIEPGITVEGFGPDPDKG